MRLTSYVHAPNLLDAKAALDQLRLGFAGARYVDGGWAVLVEGLAAAARTAGADLRTERRVSTVVREEVGWRVDVFGEASILVRSRHSRRSALRRSRDRSIVESPRRHGVELLRPARMMGLDLGLSSAVRPRASFALGMTAPTYMSVHSEAAILAPEGGALAHLSHYLAPDEAPTAETIDGLERLADDLLPGWRSHETRRQRLVGLTVSHDIPRWQAGGRRSEGQVADAAGLYLAGDWIGERGMLADAAAASARVAAEQVMTFLSEVQAVPARQASQQTGG